MNILAIPDVNQCYMVYLDYIDIKNICKCNKALSIMYCERLFKDILKRKSTQYIFDINILSVLNEFYKEVEQIFNTFFNVTICPKWVNYEQFKMSHMKTIVNEFIGVYTDLFLDIREDYINGYIDDYMSGTFRIDTGTVLCPFYSSIDIYTEEIFDTQAIYITITPTIKKYIKLTLENYFKEPIDNVPFNIRKNKFKTIIQWLLFCS